MWSRVGFQRPLKAGVMQFASLTTNSHAFECRQVKLKQGYECLRRSTGLGVRTIPFLCRLPLTCCMSSGMSLTVQACKGLWALLCWTLASSHRRVLMVLAEADPPSQHLSPISDSGLCHWQEWWTLCCYWSPGGNQYLDAHPSFGTSTISIQGKKVALTEWLQLHLQELTCDNHKQ